jgi:hypothetical protein
MNKTLITIAVTFFVIIGLYKYGHHKGWNERDAEMQAEIAKKNEEARQLEQRLVEQVNTTSKKLLEANNAVDEKQSALDRAIRAGRVRLPAPSCVQATANTPAASGDRNQTPTQPDRTPDQPSDAERETQVREQINGNR